MSLKHSTMYIRTSSSMLTSHVSGGDELGAVAIHLDTAALVTWFGRVGDRFNKS